MQIKRNGKLLASVLCTALIVAMALCTNGCGGRTGTESTALSGEETEADAVAQDGVGTGENAGDGGQALGDGGTMFMLTVTDRAGNETAFEIHTDKETVGEALLELGLIEGEQGVYGLFIKSVNGVVADYDKDGVYWAFYVNGEYAQSGVDATAITEGEAYALKVE